MEACTEKKLSRFSCCDEDVYSLSLQEKEDKELCFLEGENNRSCLISALPTRTVSYASEAQESEISDNASCISLIEKCAEDGGEQKREAEKEDTDKAEETEEAQTSAGVQEVHHGSEKEKQKEKKQEKERRDEGGGVNMVDNERQDSLFLRDEHNAENETETTNSLLKEENDVACDEALKEAQLHLFEQICAKAETFLNKAALILQQMETQEGCPSIFSSFSSLSSSSSSTRLSDENASAKKPEKRTFFSSRQKKAESDRALQELCAFFTLLFHKTFSASFWVSLTSSQYSRLRGLVFEAEILQLKALYFVREWELIRERTDLLAFGDRDPAEMVGEEEGGEIAEAEQSADTEGDGSEGRNDAGEGDVVDQVNGLKEERRRFVRAGERREGFLGDARDEEKTREEDFQRDGEESRELAAIHVQQPPAEERLARQMCQESPQTKEEKNRLLAVQWLEKRRRGALSYILSHPKAMSVFRYYERLALSRREPRPQDCMDLGLGDTNLVCRGNKHACVPFCFDFSSFVFYVRGLAEENLRYIGDAIQSYKITFLLDRTNQDARQRYRDLCQQRSENEAYMRRCVRSMFDQKGLEKLEEEEEAIQRERESEYRRQEIALKREFLRRSLRRELAMKPQCLYNIADNIHKVLLEKR